MSMPIHFCRVRTLMANDDGVQRWIVANVPYDPISVIMYRTAYD